MSAAARSASRVALQKASHGDSVWCCCWCPGAEGPAPVLLTGGLDESVKAWRAEGSALACCGEWGPPGGVAAVGCAPGAAAVLSLACTPCGLVAACSMDSAVRVWHAAAAAPAAGSQSAGFADWAWEAAPGEAWALDWAPQQPPGGADDGAPLLAVASGAAGGVSLLRPGAAGGDDAKLAAAFALPHQGEGSDAASRFTLAVAFAPLCGASSPPALAASTSGGGVFVLDAATGDVVASLEGFHEPVRSLAWDPTGRLLAAACDDGHVHVWDARGPSPGQSGGGGGGLVADFAAHDGWALCVAVSPDGSTLASGGGDGCVRLWDARAGCCAQALGGDFADAVWGLAFGGGGGGGDRLAAVSDDRSVAVYALA